MTQPVRHFLDLWRLDGETLRAILEDAKSPQGRPPRLDPRASVDADAPGGRAHPGDDLREELHPHPLLLRRGDPPARRRQVIIATASDMQLGRGEPVEDTARVLSRMVDAVMIRANRHDDVERFAQAASVPVVNGLTDRSHPCQALADVLTIEEQRGPLAGMTLAWIGDGNNVCASLIHAVGKLGGRLRIACPADYHPDLHDLARAGTAGEISITHDPREAVRDADCVLTDTWVSMGDIDHDARLQAFEPFQVDEALMSLAAEGAIFLHCLPAHRGEEVSDAVIDGVRSRVIEEAENRVHIQKSILAWCFGGVC